MEGRRKNQILFWGVMRTWESLKGDKNLSGGDDGFGFWLY